MIMERLDNQLVLIDHRNVNHTDLTWNRCFSIVWSNSGMGL